MNTHTDKKKENKSGTAANSSIQHQRNNTTALQLRNNRPEAVFQRELQETANNSMQVQQFRNAQAMVDNSPQVKQLKALQMMASEGNGPGKDKHPVQRYKYQKGATQSVTLKGQKSNKSATFDVCTGNQVTYDKGDLRQNGTGTGNADWKGWLIDQGTNNNATQLHVVNMEWGGLGGAKDGNIIPGSQALNGKHKSPEGRFKDLFDKNNKSNYDMTYTAQFSNNKVLNYNGNTITNDVNIDDPDISCEINADDKLGGIWGEGWAVPGNHGKGMIIHDGS